MARVIVQHDEFRRLARDMFAATGSDAGEAKIVSDQLVEANLCGTDKITGSHAAFSNGGVGSSIRAQR